jgi:BlaI family penicillinase repressor
MAASTSPQPTDAELSILRVLWRRGACSVREVFDELYADTDVGYTTALKLLQNMHAKGLVRRDERLRQHLYEAAVPEERTLNSLVRRLIDRSFEGSAAALAMQALGAKRATREELAELKKMIRQLEAEERSR